MKQSNHISTIGITVIFTYLLFSYPLQSQNTSAANKETVNRLFSADELQEDLLFMIENLKAYHPCLYSYTSEESFQSEIKECLKRLDTDLSIEQFYLEISPLLADVQCSHTGIRLPWEYQQSVYENGNFLPFEILLRDNKAYFISDCNGQNKKMLPGSEIISINKKPMDQIIEKLLSIIPSEGDCMTTKWNELNHNFHTYFHLLDCSAEFEVEFSFPSSTGTVKTDACHYSRLRPDAALQPNMQPVTFQIDKVHHTGILKVPSFGIMDMEGYFSLLDSAFRVLNSSHMPRLILDLRDNRGGHPIFAAQLFSYLTDENFTYFQRNNDAADFEPLYNPMPPNPNHYQGSIYVMVNGGCLSTTGHLISLLKYHTDAMFIGEEPGSSFSCNDFSFQLTLPNTGIEMNIPRTTFQTAVEGVKKGDPFPVDHVVNTTIRDVLAGRDSYLQYVFGLFNEYNSEP